MDKVGRFMSLFSGSEIAYGDWVQDRDPKAFTRHGKVTAKQYEDHLNGSIGLGIVPVNSEGTSFFGAIDLDIDTIDHALLQRAVASRGFPLNVCRSKSGGAHLYTFLHASIPASQMRQALTRWATVLGYPNVEIFPKQVRSTIENIGNWINLPYFGGDATTRYCVGSSGALSLDEFLDSIAYYDPTAQVEAPTTPSFNPQMPPCLTALQEQGVGAGARNTVLFNYAVFYRKSAPDEWETKLQFQNSQYFSPPLESREVFGVIQSASRAKYQYTCEQEPLRGLCNREVCSGLKFGVSHMPWEERGSFDELTVRNCRKLMSNPPKYQIEVNGRDITIPWEQFSNFAKFKGAIGEMLDIVPTPRKQLSWEHTVKTLLDNKTEMPAPDDASAMGLIIDKFHEFLVMRERATSKEDILRGLPVQEGTHVLFRGADFIRYLQGFKLDRKVDQPDFFLAIKSQGATHKRVRLNGKLTQVWVYPIEQINEQTQEFAIPDFRKDFEDL